MIATDDFGTICEQHYTDGATIDIDLEFGDIVLRYPATKHSLVTQEVNTLYLQALSYGTDGDCLFSVEVAAEKTRRSQPLMKKQHHALTTDEPKRDSVDGPNLQLIGCGIARRGKRN